MAAGRSTLPTTSIGLRQLGHHSTLRHGVGPKSDRCSRATLPQMGQLAAADRLRTATEYSRARKPTADGAIRSGVHTGSSTKLTSIETSAAAHAARAASVTSRAMTSSAGQPSMVGTSSIRTVEPPSLLLTRSRIPNSAMVTSGYSGSHTCDTDRRTAATTPARTARLMQAPPLPRPARSAPTQHRPKRGVHRSDAGRCRAHDPQWPPSAHPSRSRR